MTMADAIAAADAADSRDSAMRDGGAEAWAIDTHVHLASSGGVEGNVRAAADRMRAVAREKGFQCTTAVLMLADMLDQSGLDELFDARQVAPNGEEWVLHTENGVEFAESISASESGNLRLLVVQGYQVVTAEKLEVLALACGPRPKNGESLGRTLEQIFTLGGVPVLAWAVGKWLGKRGRLVRAVIEDSSYHGKLAVADNGNRPRVWGWPALLARAEELGYAVLHGSDPLPLTGEGRRIGSAGILCDPVDPLSPVDSLRGTLLSGNGIIRFGSTMPLGSFIRLQTSLRFRFSA